MNDGDQGRDDYLDLARRLGFQAAGAAVEGPVRGPHAGPSDETPLEKLHRLSLLMEALANEIGSLPSVTYQAQLWQQWSSIGARAAERRMAAAGSRRRGAVPRRSSG
ncbi:MAG: hypothetical protein GX652_08625 [Burkholderiaceae bacterium]|nr:hypothetical protein [Burkholderiaceae bacterium]